MKATTKSKLRGFTLPELIIVLGVGTILLLLLLPLLHPPATKSPRIKKCVSNLKNVGLAYRIFATDHEDKFPMAVSTNQGGSLEFVEDPMMIFRHYLALSNELSTPKILICPSDKQAKEATAFTLTSNERKSILFDGNDHISYFVGVNGNETVPQSFLSGDRNITTDERAGQRGSWIFRVSPGNPSTYRGIRWKEEMHRNQGNVGLGDGSVQQLNPSRLLEGLKNAEQETILAIPGDRD